LDVDEDAATGQAGSTGAVGLGDLVDPEALLPTSALDDLDALDTTRLRELRAACEEAEEGVSYARRLLQGRLDLLRAELERRDDGVQADLLDALPSILAADEVSTDPVKARSTRVRVPAGADAHERLLDDVLPEALVAGDEVAPEELERAVARATEHERALSELRRALFRRIDALRDELAARYKDGRADVADLLS
jgi:hypothetical protein